MNEMSSLPVEAVRSLSPCRRGPCKGKPVSGADLGFCFNNLLTSKLDADC